jgi:hypothetical protein
MINDTPLSLKLSSWKNDLPAEIDITKSSPSVPQPHQLMLHMTYYWLIILLHRPFYRRRRSFEDLDGYTDHIKVRVILYDAFLLLTSRNILSHVTELPQQSWNSQGHGAETSPYVTSPLP